MISYEAVESGARVLIEDGRYGIPWEDASEDDRAEVLSRVRSILEAATPRMTYAEDAETRDELADLLADSIYRYTGVTTSSSKSMADELIAAGYKKVTL